MLPCLPYANPDPPVRGHKGRWVFPAGLAWCAAWIALMWLGRGTVIFAYLGDGWTVQIGAGCVAVVWNKPNGWDTDVPAWGAQRNDFGRFFWAPRWSSGPGSMLVMLPLWIPLLLTGLLTLWFGLRFRRPAGRTNLCECGYDLTGNTTGVCPECGRTVGALEAAP